MGRPTTARRVRTGMGPVFGVVGALLFFLAVALFLSRRGLHRLLESMPLLEGERTVAEIHDATILLHTGGTPSQRLHQGCVARVTTSRLLIAQELGDGTHRMLSVVLAPAAERPARRVMPNAANRAARNRGGAAKNASSVGLAPGQPPST